MKISTVINLLKHIDIHHYKLNTIYALSRLNSSFIPSDVRDDFKYPKVLRVGLFSSVI